MNRWAINWGKRGKAAQQLLYKAKYELSIRPSNSMLGNWPKRNENLRPRAEYMNVCSSVSITPPRGKPCKHPSTGEGKHQLWSIHTMECYSTRKEWRMDPCDVGGAQECDAECRRTQGTLYGRAPCMGTFRKGRFTDTDTRGSGGSRGWLPMGWGKLVGWWKCSEMGLQWYGAIP